MRCSPALTRAGLTKPSSDKAVRITSDEALIGLIAAQDKDAMRLLFARHHVRVFRFLRRLISNEASAEELVTEVFLDVWRNAGRFEGRAQVLTWILGIARFKALSTLRRRTLDEIDEEVVAAIEDTADTPEVVFQKTERRAILQDCLKQLSPAHREVVDLIYYHDQSIDEVARITGVPENTVKTRAFHARKKIAELMAARGLDWAHL
ncbi:MAG TPA: sigma-70 family RNA polymerase sigma factor [Xanthobacteraceae bacterium]|jgi:RNA polymerase sigma-70 factor (ECF subfamily)|nr:sigma-70 family RNA polymerase sigma factor [Xanthobacteraceae bacterium]